MDVKMSKQTKIINHQALIRAGKNITALLHSSPHVLQNNSLWCLIRCNARRGTARCVYLSPINVCGAATVWPFAALWLIPLLMRLLCLHWPPLATHRLLFVYVAIGLLSTSIRLCLWGHDVNTKWLIKVSTRNKTPWVPCLHTQATILHGCGVKCSMGEGSQKSSIFSWAVSRSILLTRCNLKCLRQNILYFIQY